MRMMAIFETLINQVAPRNQIDFFLKSLTLSMLVALCILRLELWLRGNDEAFVLDHVLGVFLP